MARRSTGGRKKGGFLKNWAETQKINAQTRLMKMQHRLQKLNIKHHWDQVRHQRRKAFWNGVKTIGKGIGKGVKAARNLAREGYRAWENGVKSASRAADKAVRGAKEAAKPVTNALKEQRDRERRRKEAISKADQEFRRQESLNRRSKAAPDGIKTKPTSDAVKEAVQKARKTTTQVSEHQRSGKGGSHTVTKHDRKLTPSEQNQQVADTLLKKSSPKLKPKKTDSDKVVNMGDRRNRKPKDGAS